MPTQDQTLLGNEVHGFRMIDSPVLAWRALVALFFAGASMGMLSLLLPHPASYDEAGLWNNVVVAYASAAVLLLASRRLPPWTIYLFVVAGIALITRAVLLSHDPTGFYATWYVWVGLYSFFFLGRGAGIIGVVIVGAAYGFALLELPGEADTVARWAITVFTVCVGGLMVDLLAGRLRRLAERYRGIAGERADLMATLEQVARTDDLTGLPNRRAWDEELDREVARAKREGTPLCIAVLDLDRFKQYNDLLGHQAGDRFLKSVSARWRDRLRSTDVLARYGGEEFTLALPGCNTADALELIERMRSALPDAQTCSVGIAQWDREEQPTVLLGRADRALYEAKEAGRDRILVAST